MYPSQWSVASSFCAQKFNVKEATQKRRRRRRRNYTVIRPSPLLTLPCCKVTTIERTNERRRRRRKQYNRINHLTSSGFTLPWRIAKEALHLIDIAHPAKCFNHHLYSDYFVAPFGIFILLFFSKRKTKNKRL